MSEDDISLVQQPTLTGNARNPRMDRYLIRNSGQQNMSFDFHTDPSLQASTRSVRSDDQRLLQASSHTQQAIDTGEGLKKVTLVGRSQAVHFPDLRAEYLNTWLARHSLLELQKMHRASKPGEPLPQCLPPLGSPILHTTDMTLPLVTHSLTEEYISKHLLISVESFLASIGHQRLV